MANNNLAFFNYQSLDSNVASFLNEEESKYKVFTGADITAYIGNVHIGKLQGISCSINRETMPIYVMGDPNTKAYAKGKRGIAGSLVFTQFDRHAILRDLTNARGKKLQDVWSTVNTNSTFGTQIPSSGIAGGSQSIAIPLVDVANQSATFDQIAQNDLLETAYIVGSRKLNYVDQLPPFDITLTFVNESGDASTLSILGIQLVNEGWGYSLDDLHSETAYTYMARAITPLTNYNPANGTVGNPSRG